MLQWNSLHAVKTMSFNRRRSIVKRSQNVSWDQRTIDRNPEILHVIILKIHKKKSLQNLTLSYSVHNFNYISSTNRRSAEVKKENAVFIPFYDIVWNMKMPSFSCEKQKNHLTLKVLCIEYQYDGIFVCF